jgi:hypothetical protein
LSMRPILKTLKDYVDSLFLGLIIRCAGSRDFGSWTHQRS